MEPTTYNELLEFLSETRSERLTEDCCDNDEDIVDLIRPVTTSLALLRRAYAEDEAIDVDELVLLIATLERAGVQGWYQALERQHDAADMRHGLQFYIAKIEELEKENSTLKDENSSQEHRQWRGPHLEKVMDEHERTGREDAEYLAQIKTLRERLVDAKREKCVLMGRILQGDPNMATEVGSLEEMETTTGKCLDEESKRLELLVGSMKPPTVTQGPTKAEETDAWSDSSTAAQVGNVVDNSSASYPPPLAAATEEGIKADERKTDMLSQVENTLWIQESKDREYLLKKASPAPLQARRPPSSPLDDFEPFNIHVPLPRNFNIPQINKRLPSLTFPTPASVFHFPDCATRDQLLALLRKGVDEQNLPPAEEVNVIRVRTHELEWELKNAIRRIMRQEDWNHVVGDEWSTEGQGDTYIVSNRDVQFHGLGDEDESAPQSSGSEAVAKAPSDGKKENKRCEDGGRDVPCKGNKPDQIPKLRGGGALEPFPSLTTSPLAEYFDGDQGLRTLGDCCEVSPCTLIHEDDPSAQLQAWVHHARILQLQSSSQTRLVQHLQEIIADTEGTIQWQDEELTRAHNYIEELKLKLKDRKEEVRNAGRKARLARAETQILQDRLEQIHDQVTRFSTELDGKMLQIEAQYASLSREGSPKAVEMRGGGGGGESLSEQSVETQEQNHRDHTSTPSPTAEAQAHSFYFFPTVSMLVVLSNPLHHFQFPARTSLARVRQTLYALHAANREPDTHLRHVRAVLQARDAAGIGLPDTSNGRQVLISAPQVVSSASSQGSGKAGFKDQWNKTFGPSEYRYEHILQKSIEGLAPPTADARTLLSPARGGPCGEKSVDAEEDEFYNAADLVDEIEHEAELSRKLSGCDLRDTREVAQETGKGKAKKRSRKDSLGEKRGYTMALELPPTSLGPMFPGGVVGRAQSARVQRISPGDYGLEGFGHGDSSRSTHRHPGVRGPDVHSPNPAHARLNPRTKSSSKRPFAPAGTDREGKKKSPHGKETPDDGWGTWRHGKGEGCEAWTTPSGLDAGRLHCAFCSLPFAQAGKPRRSGRRTGSR